MITILVTGANGQLGKELQTAASQYSSYRFIFTDRSVLPVGEEAAVKAFFARESVDYCVNCAAYTAVDKAESEQEQAFAINGDAVGYLAGACASAGAKFIHVSTDYVFDGESSVPLKEEDPTGPVNVYGASKLRGEQLALQYNADSVVIRTSWVYSEFGNNFVKTMIRLMGEKPSLNVVDDQIGSPTYAADLAEAILQIIGSGHFVPGIYHYSNEGVVSWYEFALAIRDLIGSACPVHPIPSAQFPTPAKRPHYSLLDKGRIRAVYGIGIPAWKESLAICLQRLHVNL